MVSDIETSLDTKRVSVCATQNLKMRLSKEGSIDEDATVNWVGYSKAIAVEERSNNNWAEATEGVKANESDNDLLNMEVLPSPDLVEIR
jgi:hypothetical protein